MKNMSQRQSGIAIVRLSKGNTKLEIACYKNKVLAYRDGIETRIDEVLQAERVFINVATGEFASNADMFYVIGKKKISEREAVQYILDNGVLQIAQGERGAELEVIMKDICTVISQKCVNKVTKKPFPAAIIEQSLKAIGVTIRLDDSVKKQALQFIKALEDSQLLPIERALMKVRCTGPDPELQAALRGMCAHNPRCELLDSRGIALDASTPAPTAGPASYLFLMEPHLFRDVERLCGSVQVIESSVMDISEKFLGAGLSAQVAAAIASPNAVMAANAGGAFPVPASSSPAQRSKPSEGTSSTTAKPTAAVVKGSSIASSSEEADKKTGRQKAEERKLKRQQKKAAKNAAADEESDKGGNGNKDDFSDDEVTGGKSKKKLSRRKNNSKGMKKDDGDDNDPIVEQDLNSSDEELLTNRKARKRQNK